MPWFGLGGARAGGARRRRFDMAIQCPAEASGPDRPSKSKLFAMSVVTSIASFSAQMLAFVSLPFYLQGVLHHSQVETGLLMTPWPVAAGVAAFIAGLLADRFSAAIFSAAGLRILALGFYHGAAAAQRRRCW